MPGQWEYQVGPCTGIDSPDQLIISRYLMERVCEQFGAPFSIPFFLGEDRCMCFSSHIGRIGSVGS